MQVFAGVDAQSLTVGRQRVEDGAAITGFRMADEQPVSLADSRGPNGVLDQVVVDLDTTVGKRLSGHLLHAPATA